MNRHTDKPACHTDHGHERNRMEAFRDEAQVCYVTDAEVERLTPGCAGCGRRKAPPDVSERIRERTKIVFERPEPPITRKQEEDEFWRELGREMLSAISSKQRDP